MMAHYLISVLRGPEIFSKILGVAPRAIWDFLEMVYAQGDGGSILGRGGGPSNFPEWDPKT